MHQRAVAGQQEARQGRRQHDRIAHRDVDRALPDFVLAPGHRHDAHGAGEVGNVERDIGGAVLADGDDAGIERDRRPGRRTAVQFRAFVAAGADFAARALHAVDQLAVKIADIGRQRALAEIIVGRRRRLVIGEIEDADIDGGNRDPRLLAGGKAGDLDAGCATRYSAATGRRLQIDGERLRRLVDREPLHADGAARHALRRRIERPAQGRNDIGAGAPVAADRDFQFASYLP